MTIAITISDFHGLPAGTQLVVISQFVDCQGSDILVVERADGQLLPCLGGPCSRTNIAANLTTIGKAPVFKLTRNQIDALLTLSQYVGQTVLVLTSGYTANVAPKAVSDAVGTCSSAALRGLEAKGFIHIDDAFWKGAVVTVLKGLPELR